MILLAAVGGMTVIGGLLLVIAGVRRSPDVGPRPAGRRRSLLAARSKHAAAVRNAGLVGLVLGLLVGISSGWLIAIIAVPLATMSIPILMRGSHGKQRIAKLEGLGEWTRSLSGVLSAGVGLDQGIEVTLSRSTPESIRSEVSVLVSRIRSGWDTTTALRAFADDIADPTGDAIVAGLILAAGRPGTAGVSRMLEGIAERATEDIRNRRRIESDLAGPRTTVRWITILTPVFAILMLLIQRDYMGVYSTPMGQAFLLLLLIGYLGILLWLRRVSRGRPQGRLLGTVTEDEALRERSTR